jgi:hypothetical protein
VPENPFQEFRKNNPTAIYFCNMPDHPEDKPRDMHTMIYGAWCVFCNLWVKELPDERVRIEYRDRKGSEPQPARIGEDLGYAAVGNGLE